MDATSEGHGFVERDHWVTDVLSLVVTAVGFVVVGFSVAWLANLSWFTGLVLTAWVWAAWWAVDVVQAAVWRLGRR